MACAIFGCIVDTPPPLLAKVRLRNRVDVYLVVDVNKELGVVELISITGTQHTIPYVPITAIRELVEPPPDHV